MAKISCQRSLFAIPEDVAYLNTAYMSPQLDAVSRAGHEAVDLKARPWELGDEHWFERVERLRGAFGDWIGGDADGVALVPSASYGMATAARNIPVAPKRTILLIAEQFPSAVYPWRRKVETGAEIVTVQRPDDDDWTAAILSPSTPAAPSRAFHPATGQTVP